MRVGLEMRWVEPLSRNPTRLDQLKEPFLLSFVPSFMLQVREATTLARSWARGNRCEIGATPTRIGG